MAHNGGNSAFIPKNQIIQALAWHEINITSVKLSNLCWFDEFQDLAALYIYLVMSQQSAVKMKSFWFHSMKQKNNIMPLSAKKNMKSEKKY